MSRGRKKVPEENHALSSTRGLGCCVTLPLGTPALRGDARLRGGSGEPALLAVSEGRAEGGPLGAVGVRPPRKL